MDNIIPPSSTYLSLGKVVLEAVRGARLYQLHFGDAQIWAIARLHNLPLILSEDFNAGAQIEDVRFINPFASDFEPATWKNMLE